MKKKGLIVFGLDLLHIILFIGILNILSFIMSTEIEKLPSVSDAINSSIGNNIINTFMAKFYIYILIALLISILNWSIIKGIIWTRLMNKKFDKIFIKKFYILNFILFFIGIFVFFILNILLSLVSTSVDKLRYYPGGILVISAVYIFVIIPIMIYLLNIISILYIKFLTKKRYIEETANIVFKKAKKLYLPYLSLSIILFALSIIAKLFIFNNKAYTITSSIVILLFLTFNKFYIIEVVKKIK